MVVVTAFSVLVVIGYSDPFLADGASLGHRIAIGILVGVAVYAVALFLVTLITLADVGGTYIRWLQAKRPSGSSDT